VQRSPGCGDQHARARTGYYDVPFGRKVLSREGMRSAARTLTDQRLIYFFG